MVKKKINISSANETWTTREPFRERKHGGQNQVFKKIASYTRLCQELNDYPAHFSVDLSIFSRTLWADPQSHSFLCTEKSSWHQK